LGTCEKEEEKKKVEIIKYTISKELEGMERKVDRMGQRRIF
jgi:hypothetical protein